MSDQHGTLQKVETRVMSPTEKPISISPKIAEGWHAGVIDVTAGDGCIYHADEYHPPSCVEG